MTEESFQQGRKIMASANYLRGIITKAKANVGKWTKLEDANRRNLKEATADGCKKKLDQAMIRLNEVREKFAAIKFPESDIVIKKEGAKAQCQQCGNPVAIGNDYCGECLCEDDSDY